MEHRAAPSVKTILVMNKRDHIVGYKPAVIIKTNGEQHTLPCLTYYDDNNPVDASQACTLTWKNQLWIFGARSNFRQIGKLDQGSKISTQN